MQLLTRKLMELCFLKMSAQVIFIFGKCWRKHSNLLSFMVSWRMWNLQGMAEGVVTAESGEEEAEKGLHCSLELPGRMLQLGEGLALFSGDKAQGDGFKLHQKRIGLNIRKNFFTEGCQTLKEDAQEKWWIHHPWRQLRNAWMWH